MTTRSPAHLLEPPPQRSALALVAFLEHQLESELLLQPRQDVPRPVLRPIVDDDQLRPDRHGDHAPDDLLDRVTLVVDGHDDREERIGKNAAERGE